MVMPRMTIGRLAATAGVGVETVRFYERSGLVMRPSRPTAGGFRVYDPEAVARIRFIREAQRLGFSLGEIRELLSLRATPGADCRAVRAQAVAKRDEVERKIARLRQMRGALDELIATCPGGGALRACTILDALERSARTGRRANEDLLSAPALPARRSKAWPKAGAVKSSVLAIRGMHCEGCAQTLQFLLGRAAGVRNAEVSFAAREARILHDPRVCDAAQLAAVVKRAGFAVSRGR
jgi:DNA-binding transcriptional MerR regulator/copper chaperone CopZ